MEAAPPSYEKATVANPWDLIAPYISSNDLCSAALVCEAWNDVFSPYLWGNPASHFGTENDRVYVALTKFKRTLPWARLCVRSLTHTLHLPPAHAELYYGPHVDWLREVLVRLPNLQSLIVRGLPFFDHACLNALKYLQAPRSDSPYPQVATFGLRLLDASRLSNVTAIGLCQALQRFNSMSYLDLSFTYPARDHAVLKMLRYMDGLQVLKLRGISLRDEDVEALAAAISTRVRSLDLRNNQLTDRSVRTLLDLCFTPAAVGEASILSGRGDRSPSLLHYLGAEMLAIYRGEHYESYLRQSFTTGFINRLAIEETPESGTGVTHLYISENQLSVEGVSGLLRSKRLHVLDVGAVKPDLNDQLSPSQEEYSDCTALPGAEKLTPVSLEAAGQNLTFLRIDHRLVTREPEDFKAIEIIPGRVEIADTSLPRTATPPPLVELPDNPIYELPADPIVRYELPGDPIHVVVTSPPVKTPNWAEQERYDACKGRRGSSNAPEVDYFLQDPQDCSLHPVSLNQDILVQESAGTSTSEKSHKGRSRSYSSVVAERANRVKAHLTETKGFHPGILPHLVTLVLTDLPPFSPSPITADRLVALIRDCADEAKLADAQAQVDYSAPPGRKGYASTVRDSARGIFALQEIVLEVARAEPIRRKGAASAWRHHTTKSVTQDHDSEALASAAETDFSFFSEHDYDHDMPSLEASRSVPFPAMYGLEVVSHDHGPPPAPPSNEHNDEYNSQPRLDVIAKVAEFRKAKKAAYQAHISYGETDPQIDGFWTGVVKVIRPAHNLNPADEDSGILVDYYGNRFSKANGYLYR